MPTSAVWQAAIKTRLGLFMYAVGWREISGPGRLLIAGPERRIEIHSL